MTQVVKQPTKRTELIEHQSLYEILELLGVPSGLYQGENEGTGNFFQKNREDYGYSKNAEDRANLVVIIWNNNYETYSDGEMGTLDIQSIEPIFCIKKNIYGFADENVRLPIYLLPAFLIDPSQSLTWSKDYENQNN